MKGIDIQTHISLGIKIPPRKCQYCKKEATCFTDNHNWHRGYRIGNFQMGLCEEHKNKH